MKFILKENIEPSQVDLSGFDLQSKLNPKLWDEKKHLNSSVRLSLLVLANDFIQDAGIQTAYDIIMTGSLANYNWNEKYSDIDLHILVDYNDLSSDPAVAKQYYAEKKTNWNRSHDKISMFGYPVELYVQDVHEPHKSTGVYSLMNDKWVVEPSLDKLPNTSNTAQVKSGVSVYCNMIDALIATYNDVQNNKSDVSEVLRIADKIYEAIRDERKQSMATAKFAELTTGNLIFKSLRRNGYIEKLINLRRACYDNLRSL
jgi:hypothetical protein